MLLENIAFSLNTVLPSFIMIFLGFLAVKRNILNHSIVTNIGNLAFKYCLSVRIFLDVSNASINDMKELRMSFYSMAATIITYSLAWIFAWRFLKRKESRGSFIQACFRSSFTVLGLSMVRNMAGETGVAKCAALFSMVVLVYNFLAVLCLSGFSGDNQSAGSFSIIYILKDVLLKLIYNPLIIAVAIGLPFSIFSLRLPGIIMKPVSYLGDMAIPLSLLCIGASLDTSKIKNCFRYAIGAAFTKTILFGIVVIPVAVLLGFRGLELAIIGILFTTANPAACYIMAVAMKNDGDLAATAIVFSTIFSVFTTSITLYILRSLALI